MDNPFKSPNVISLCPGILGLERGLIRAIGEIDVITYVEIEAFIIANLVAAMETGKLAPAPIWTDLKTFDPKPFCGKVHGIIGGYPCQPFSVAGQRNGEGDPRHLWPFIREHIRAIRPVWCFFENVGGHLSMGFDTVYKDLRSLGYNIEAGIFTAEEVGAPHQRERLFILAIKSDRMGNSKSSECECSISTRARGDGFTNNDYEMAYSDCDGHRTISRRTIEASHSVKGKKQWKERHKIFCQWMRDVAWNSNTSLANTGSLHEQGKFRERTNEERRSFTSERPSGSQSLFNGWPAPPGYDQYEWEEPRTVEPGVGCTIDGYNFREDLLRALGNSVVEQTAELAFRTLLHKHFFNSNQV